MNDLKQWKQDLENYYRNLFFMDPKHKNDWQEAARQAAESQYQVELLKRQTSVNLPEVTVTASNPTKTVATESDWDPGYTKFMSGEQYYADQGHKNYLDLQRNDYTRGIRETTDKWGKGIGLGMTAAAAMPFVVQAAPVIVNGIKAFRAAHPIISGAIDAGLTVDGIRHALSDNGVKKTINYATEGNWGRAAASGTMDALDLLGGIGLIDDVIKVIPKILDGYNFLKLFKGITGFDKKSQTYKFIKGQKNFGEKLGSGAESMVYAHPLKPDLVLKVHMTVAPHGEYTLYGIRDAITAKNKIPHFNKEDYVGWVYNKNWKAFHPVYALKKFDSNTYLPLHYEEEAMLAANKLGVGISDMRFENTAKIGDEVFINDLSITGYPKTNKILPIEKYFMSVNRIKNGINRGIGNVRHKLYLGATKIVRNRLLKKIAKSSDLLQLISVMGRVFDTNPRIAPNPFFRLIEDSYPNFDKNLLDDLYNMYFDDRSSFFELLNSYKGKDTGSHTIIQLPNESNSFYIKSGGSIHIKKKNKGKFTTSAKAAGEGVQEHAHKVMNDPNATPLQKKRANFAIQAKKWHRKHQSGGKINYLNIF